MANMGAARAPRPRASTTSLEGRSQAAARVRASERDAIIVPITMFSSSFILAPCPTCTHIRLHKEGRLSSWLYLTVLTGIGCEHKLQTEAAATPILVLSSSFSLGPCSTCTWMHVHTECNWS